MTKVTKLRRKKFCNGRENNANEIPDDGFGERDGNANGAEKCDKRTQG